MFREETDPVITATKTPVKLGSFISIPLELRGNLGQWGGEAVAWHSGWARRNA